MLDIPTLLDRAKARQSLTSDGQLSRALGLTDSVVHQYRFGKTLPSAEIARRIAELAGEPQAEAVLAVLELQARDDHLRRLYRAMAAKISAAVFLALAVLSSSTIVENAAGTNQRPDYQNLYIMRYLRRLLGRCRGWLRRVSGGARQPSLPVSRTESARAAAAYSAVCRRVADCRDWRPRVMP